MTAVSLNRDLKKILKRINIITGLIYKNKIQIVNGKFFGILHCVGPMKKYNENLQKCICTIICITWLIASRLLHSIKKVL